MPKAAKTSKKKHQRETKEYNTRIRTRTRGSLPNTATNTNSQPPSLVNAAAQECDSLSQHAGTKNKRVPTSSRGRGRWQSGEYCLEVCQTKVENLHQGYSRRMGSLGHETNSGGSSEKTNCERYVTSGGMKLRVRDNPQACGGTVGSSCRRPNKKHCFRCKNSASSSVVASNTMGRSDSIRGTRSGNQTDTARGTNSANRPDRVRGTNSSVSEIIDLTGTNSDEDNESLHEIIDLTETDSDEDGESFHELMEEDPEDVDDDSMVVRVFSFIDRKAEDLTEEIEFTHQRFNRARRNLVQKSEEFYDIYSSLGTETPGGNEDEFCKIVKQLKCFSDGTGVSLEGSSSDQVHPAGTKTTKVFEGDGDSKNMDVEQIEPDTKTPDPVKTETSQTDPIREETDNTDAISAETGTTQPIRAEADKTHPIRAESGTTLPVRAEADKTHPIRAESNKTHPIRAEADKTHPISAESNKTHAISAESNKTHPIRAESTTTLPVRVESGKTHQLHAETDKTHPIRTQTDKTHLVRAESGTTHPVRAESDKTDPIISGANTHPISTEACTTDPISAETGTTDPIREETDTSATFQEESGKTHQLHAETDKTHPVRTQTDKTHPISAETGTTHPIRTESDKTDPISTEAGITHPISAETGTTDPIREETGTSDSMREETDTSATFREETGKTDPMRDKTKKNSHKTPTSLIQFEPQDIYEQSKPTTLSDSLSMVYHSMQGLHGKRKLSSSVHETYGKSKILKLTDVSTVSCDIVSRSLWNDFCITTECTDVEHVSCKTAECDTSPKQAPALFPSETAGTKNDGERKANTVAENDAKKDISAGPDIYTVAKNDTEKHNTDIRIVIYPGREVITVAKTDIARGTNTVSKTDSVRGTNALAKADSARGKYSGNKTDSVEVTHSVNRTDAARGTNSVTKTDSVRGTNSATKTDSVRGTNTMGKTDHVKGTNTVAKSDTARGTNIVSKSDSVRGTNTVTKTDSVRGTNTMAKTDSVRGTNTVAKTDNGRGTNTVTKTDTAKGTNTMAKTDNGRGTNTVAKTDSVRGTNSATKTDNGRGTNTVAKTDSVRGTITVAKTDNGRGTNTVAKTDNGRGTNTVAKTDNGRGTNTVAKTDTAKGTNTVAKTDTARGKKSGTKTDSVGGTNTVGKTDSVRGTNSVTKTDSVRGTNTVAKTDTARGTNTVAKSVTARGTNTVSKTDSVRVTNTVAKTDTARGTNTVSKSDSVRGTNSVTKTDSVRGTNTVSKSDSVRGTNTVAKTDSVRGTNTMAKSDSVRGTNTVSKPDSVRGTNTVSKPDSVRGTNTMAKPDSVRGTNTVSKPDSVRGTNTMAKPDSVRGTNTVSKTDSVRGTDSVAKPDSVRGTNTVAKTDSVRGTNTLAKTDTAKGTNTVTKIDSVRGTNTVAKTDSVRGTNTVAKTDSVRGTTTVAKTDSVRGTNTVIKTDSVRGTTTVAKTDSVRGTNTVIKTDTVRGTNTVAKTDSVRGTNTMGKTDHVRGTNTVAKPDSVRGTTTVAKTDSVRGTNTVGKTDSVRGTNTVAKPDNGRGTNTVTKTDSVRGTNTVSKSDSVRGTNTVAKTDNGRGTNTVTKTDSVKGTNTVSKSDSVRGTNTVAKTDSVRGKNTVAKSDSVRGTDSVAKTDSVRGTNTVAKTDSVRGTNTVAKTDTAKGTNTVAKTDSVRGTDSVAKTDSVRGTNTVAKTDSVRGTNTVAKTDTAKGTNTVAKTDSVRGTNTVTKTDSVRGTDSVSKSDSVRGTISVAKTDSVRGTNTVAKTDSVRGTDSVSKSDSVRGTISVAKTDSVRGTNTVAKTDSAGGTNTVAKTDSVRGTNSCTKSDSVRGTNTVAKTDSVRGTDTVAKTDSAGGIHEVGRTDLDGSVTVANKGSKSACGNISGGLSQGLKSCEDPALCVQENTRQGNRTVMDNQTSAILMSSGLNKSFPISESSSGKTNCITSQCPSDLSQPLPGRNLLNMLLKETLFCRTTSVDLPTNVMSDISKNLGVAAAASLQNELLRQTPSTTASSLTEVKKDASRAAVTHGPEQPQDLKKDHRVRQILATIQNYETKVKTEPLEYLLPSPPKGAFSEKNTSDLSASPLSLAVNSQLTIKGETSLPTTTVNVAQDLSEINSYSVSHGCRSTPNLKTEVFASSVNMGQMYDSNDTLNMQNTTSYAQNRRIQDAKEPSGSVCKSSSYGLAVPPSTTHQAGQSQGSSTSGSVLWPSSNGWAVPPSTTHKAGLSNGSSTSVRRSGENTWLPIYGKNEASEVSHYPPTRNQTDTQPFGQAQTGALTDNPTQIAQSHFQSGVHSVDEGRHLLRSVPANQPIIQSQSRSNEIHRQTGLYQSHVSTHAGEINHDKKLPRARSRWDQQARVTNAKGSPLVPNLKTPSSLPVSELYKQPCGASRWDQQSRITNAKGSPLVQNLKTPSAPVSKLNNQPSALGYSARHTFDNQATKVFSVSNSQILTSSTAPMMSSSQKSLSNPIMIPWSNSPILTSSTAPVMSSSQKSLSNPIMIPWSNSRILTSSTAAVMSSSQKCMSNPKMIPWSNSRILTSSTAPMMSSSQKSLSNPIMIPWSNSPILTSSTAPMMSSSQKSLSNPIMIPWTNSPILTSSTAPVMSSSQKSLSNPIMIPWSNSPILTSSTAPMMSLSQKSTSNALQQSASATNLPGDSSSVTNMNTLPGTDFYFKALSTIPVLSTVTQSSSVSNIQTYSTGETTCFSNMNTSPMTSLTFQTLPPVQLLLSTLQTVPAPHPSGPSGKPPQMSPSRRLPSIATLLPNPLPLMSCRMSNPEHSSVDMAKPQLRLSLLQTQLNSPMSVIGPQALNVISGSVENPCPNQPNSPMSVIGPHALNVISGSVENPCPNQANSPMSVIGPHTLNVIPGTVENTVENPCPNQANSPMSVIGPQALNVMPPTVENPCPNQPNSPMSVIGPHTLNVIPGTGENPCPNQPNSSMFVIGPHTLNVMPRTVENPCPNQPNSPMSVIGPQALNEIPGTVENHCPNHPDNFWAVKQQMSGHVNDQPLLTSSLSSNRDQINTSENGKIRFTIKRHHRSLDQNSWNVGGAFPSHQGGLSDMCTSGQKHLEKGIAPEAGKRLLMGKRFQDRSFRKTKTVSETFSLSEELKTKSYTQNADVDLNILAGVSNKPEVKVEIEDSSSHEVSAKVGTASELLIQPGVSSELLSQEKVIDDKVSVSAPGRQPTILWDKDVSDHEGPTSKQNEMTFSHKIPLPTSASVAPKQTESDLCSTVKQGTVSRERFPGTFSVNVRVASLKQKGRGRSQGSNVSTLLKPVLDYNSWAASLLKHPVAPTSEGNDLSSLLNVTSTSPPSREQDSLSASSQRPTAGSAGEPASRGCSASQQHQISDETGELTSTYVQDIADPGSKIYNRCSLSHDGDNSAEIGPASERKSCGPSKEVQNAGDQELSSRVNDSWLSSSHDVPDSFVVGSTKSQLEGSLPSLQVDGTEDPTLPETLDGGQKHEHCPCEGDDNDASHETAENNTNSDDIETGSKWDYGESCARAQYRLSNNRRINRSAFEQMLVMLYTNKKPGLIYVNNKDRKVPFASYVGGELGFISPWVTVMKPDLDNQEMIDVETVIADEDLGQSEHEVDVRNTECLKVESSTSNTAVKATQQMFQGKTVSNGTKKRKRKSIDDLKKKRFNKKYKSQQDDLYRSPCYNRKLASELPRRCSRSFTRRSGGREISSEEDSSREPCSVSIDSNQEFQRRRSTRLVIKDSISSQDNGCRCDSLIRQRRSCVHSCFACSRTDTHCTGDVKNITDPTNRSSGGHRRRSTRLIIKESIVEEWVRTTGTQLQKEEIAPNPLKDLPSDADATPSQTRMFYVCGSTCGFSSLYGDELKMHASYCTLPGALDCHHCGFTASDGDALVAHVHNHSDRYGNLHECSVPNCEFETNVLHSYQTHVQEHHPLVTRHVCNDCKSVYSDMDGLIQHVHDNLLLIVWCKYCDAIACEERVILDHIEKVHQKTLGTWTMNELLCGERKSVAKLGSQLHGNPSVEVGSLPGSFSDGVETSDASVEDQDVDMVSFLSEVENDTLQDCFVSNSAERIFPRQAGVASNDSSSEDKNRFPPW